MTCLQVGSKDHTHGWHDSDEVGISTRRVALFDNQCFVTGSTYYENQTEKNDGVTFSLTAAMIAKC